MKKQNWIVKFINKVDLPWGLSKEQLEELRKEVEQLTSENLKLTAENLNLSVRAEVLQMDCDNLTRTLEEANEELSALNSENLKLLEALTKTIAAEFGVENNND